MSNLARFRRSRRLLAFRHVFPEAVAPWIQFRRLLLRVRWLFTFPVDRMFQAATNAALWPFVALWGLLTRLWNLSTGELLRARILLAQWSRSLGELLERLRETLTWVGRVPVWTAAALSGAFGVILTLLLFLFPLMADQPPLASIALPTGREVVAAPEVSSDAPTDESFVLPDVSEQEFNPFALLPGQPQPIADLSLRIDTLPEREFTVVSTSAVFHTRTDGSRFELVAFRDGWNRSDSARRLPTDGFVPYVRRIDVLQSTPEPSWATSAETVPASDARTSERLPTLSVEKFVPGESALGQSLRYELVVSNRGEEPLDNVTVRERVPDIERIVDVRPQATIVDGELQWALARLASGERRRLVVELQPAVAAPLEQTSRVEVTTRVAAETLVQAPRPEPSGMRDSVQRLAPERREESERMSPFAREEPGGAAALGVTPPDADRPVSPPSIRSILPFVKPETLPPAEAHSEAQEENDPPPFPPSTSVTPTAPHELQFSSRTMDRAAVGGAVWTVFEVHNPSEADATDLVLRVNLSDELTHRRGRVLEHRIAHLGAGETYRTKLTTRALSGGTGMVASTLTDRRQIEESARSRVKIRPRPPLISGALSSGPLVIRGCCRCGS